MKMRAPAGVLGLVLVAGCGSSGLETGAGTVEEKTAETFVVGTETDWRQGVDTTSGVNLSSEARCYFVTGDDNKSLGTMACGPVRRLGSADGAVWDLVAIEGTTGDETGLRISDGATWQRSVVRPADGSLTRPDDKQPPADADKLALPPAPPAGSRLSLVQDEITSDLAPHNEPLIAPDVTVTLTGLGSVPTIGEGTQTKSPAPDERFVVARFTTAPTIDPLSDGPSGTTRTSWAIAADTDARPVNLMVDNPRQGPRYLIASVPEDAKEVSLTATTGSVTQTLSLLTGKRTSTDVAGAYYRPKTSVTLNKSLPVKRVKVGRDFDASYGITLTEAALSPWDPRQGWAPAGKAWFRFLFTDQGRTPDALYRITWNPRFFTLAADGRPVAMPPTGESREGEVVTAAVPADVRTVRVTVTATLSFASHAYSFSAAPKSGTATFGTLTADAAFG